MGWIRSARSVCATSLLTAAICAQMAPFEPIEGYSQSLVNNDPSSTFGLPGFAFGITEGDLYLPNRNTIRRVDVAIDNFMDLHVLPVGHDVGLITSPPGSFAVYFSDFQADTLFRFDLTTEVLTSRPLPTNAFDLITTSIGGDVLVSANPNFPLPGAASGVWLVDPNGGGQHRELIHLSGPSGPLAFDPQNGDLLVAVIPNVVPPAPGSVSILRFAATQVQAQIATGSAPLGATDATLTIDQLDGAYDMVFDPRGRLYVSDVNHEEVYRLLPGATSFEATPFAGQGTDTVSSLAFREFGIAPFEAFEPASGNALFVLGSNFFRGTAVHAIRASRPTFTSTPGPDIPTGPFTLQLEGAPANSPAWILFGFGPPPPFEISISFGHSRLLRFGIDPATPIVIAPIGTDNNGAATLALAHAAGPQFLTLQVLAFDGGPTVPTPALVSSTPLPIRLTP